MKKSLFIGQKVKDEGSKVLFVGIYMFAGNGFSNDKPRISTGQFCYLLFLLFSFYFLLFLFFPLPRHRLRRCHSLSGEGEFYKCLVGGKQNNIVVPL